MPRIPDAFEVTHHYTERTVNQRFVEWINRIIEEKNLDFGVALQETGLSNRQSPDIIIQESPGSKRVICLIELKLPHFDALGESELLEPASKKAYKVRSPYFATSNIKQLILFSTQKSRSLASLPEQMINVYPLANIADPDTIDQPAIRLQIQRHLERFLLELLEIAKKKKAVPKIPLDEILIYRLRSAINSLQMHYQVLIKEKITEAKFARKLRRWFNEQGWDFSGQAPDLERVARQAAYLLINKIVFYTALEEKLKLNPISIPPTLTDSRILKDTLQAYFNRALDIDYETIFTTDFIDELAFPQSPDAIITLKEVLEDIKRYRMSRLDYDIIGRIFERLIPFNERHQLGQYFTRSDIVDLILGFCLDKENDKVFDPACGTGTFLVRAYKYKQLQNPRREHQAILETLWGGDIAKFPVSLATINLAVRDLRAEENYPGMFQKDFFKLHPDLVEFTPPRKVIVRGVGKQKIERELPRYFDCLVGNPPYTRQEEMEELIGGEGYKKEIIKTVTHYRNRKIADLGKRAGIHAHFFLHGWKFLIEGGRFGFIVSNSWLDVDYGKFLQEFFLKHYKIVAIIESKVERWFEDADVNTCIVILEKCSQKKARDENRARFVYLKKPLTGFIPPAEESWEKEIQRRDQIKKLKRLVLGHREFYENEELRIYPKLQKELWEEGYDQDTRKYSGAKWGKYIRAPQIFFKILEKRKDKLVPLKEIAEVRFGIKTGANAFFYLTEDQIKRWGIEKEFWMHPLPRNIAPENNNRRDRSHDATENNNRSVATPVVTNIAPVATNNPHQSKNTTKTRKNPSYTLPYKTWGKSRSLRLKDFDYISPGVVYHLTIGANKKRNIFTHPSLNQAVIATLKDAAKLYGYKLIAYCLMPDHLHILVQAGETPKDLRGFVRGFKSYCSVATPVATNIATPVATENNNRSIATPVATDCSLWQRGFYEHILRKNENIAEVAEYILNNPIRKGLIEERGQYKWCELITEVDDAGRRDRSHDATENNNCSVATPVATDYWIDKGGEYFKKSQYAKIHALEGVLIDDDVVWIPNYVIKSPRECKSIVVKPEELKYRVLMIRKDKKDLKGTKILKYIKEGERRGYHKRPTCAGRNRWYDLGKLPDATLLFRQFFDIKFDFPVKPATLYCDHTFYYLCLRKLADTYFYAGLLNSTFHSFLTEIYARNVMGQGVLIAYGPEIKPIPMLDINKISPDGMQNILKAIKKLLIRSTVSIFDELGANSPKDVSLDKVKPDRRELDKIVMGDILGLTDEEQLEVYRAVVDLVKSRLDKANSVKRENKIKDGIDIDAFVKTVMERVGEQTPGKFFKEKIASHKPLASKNLPQLSGEIKIESDIEGCRLYCGKKYLLCATQSEARYLKVWLEAGLESIKIPQDKVYLARIVPRLEKLMQKIKETVESYTDSILQLKLRQKILHQIWQSLTDGVR